MRLNLGSWEVTEAAKVQAKKSLIKNQRKGRKAWAHSKLTVDLLTDGHSIPPQELNQVNWVLVI